MGRISFPQGKGNQMHNRREYEKYGIKTPENIDSSRTHLNITFLDRNIKEVYQEVFGEAVAEYNAKQKRADRKIDNYYDHIAKSKNGEKLFYEDVVQWGEKEDFINNPEQREKAGKALEEYISTFEERNPNLKLIGAYIHLDEASPHLHLDYVPVAHGYTRGVSVRNSLDRAMKEMGFTPEKESKKNNATKLWKENERKFFSDICRSYGLEVETERKSTRKNLSVEEYKDAKDRMMGEIAQEVEQQEQKLATNNSLLDQQERAIEENKVKLQNIDSITAQIRSKENDGVKIEAMTIPEKRSFLGKVEAPERTGVFIENMKPKQIKALMERVKADTGIEKALKAVQERCNLMIRHAREEAERIKAEATAERNDKIAQATFIVKEERNIIQKAKDFAQSIEQEYNGLKNKIKSLLGQKEALEQEVAEITAYKGKLEPLRAEYEQLREGVQIMSGQLDNQITQAKFKDWHTMPSYARYDAYRESGELIALYKDGTVRKVGTNDRGGWDYKTLDDQAAGKCRVGIMQPEERVSVPKSLVNELIASRDRSKAVSENLSNFIQQQTRVNEVRKDRGRDR